MEAPFFSVLVVNYNGGNFLRACIESVLQQTDEDFELLVLDNASTDGSLETLDSIEDLRLTIITSDENLGFASGNNLLAAKARGEWLALLNPDAEAAPGWLAALRQGTEQFGDHTLLASVQRALGQPGILDGLGDAYLGIGVPWRGGWQREDSLIPDGPREVFGPCGAALTISRSFWSELGGFPDHFFCYCEDVDLCARARLVGGRAILLPQAEIAHAGSGILGIASPFALFHGTRNRLWVFARTMPGAVFWLVLPVHLAATFTIAVYGLRKGRAGPTFRGLFAGLKEFRNVLRERRRVQAARKVSTISLLRAMSWNPLRMLQRAPDLRPVSDQAAADERDAAP